MLDVSDERANEGAVSAAEDREIDLGSERGPVRTCVGCRQRDEKDALLRLAIVPAELRGRGPAVLVDIAKKAPGRGLSVHPTLACLKAAVERGGIAKAVRGAPGVTTAGLTAAILEKLEARIDGLLGGGRRARKLAVGSDAASEAIGAGRARALLVAADALGKSGELRERAAAAGAAVATFRDKARLGELVRPRAADEVPAEVGVVAILDEGIAAEVLRALGRVEQLTVTGAQAREVSEGR